MTVEKLKLFFEWSVTKIKCIHNPSTQRLSLFCKKQPSLRFGREGGSFQSHGPPAAITKSHWAPLLGLLLDLSRISGLIWRNSRSDFFMTNNFSQHIEDDEGSTLLLVLES